MLNEIPGFCCRDSRGGRPRLGDWLEWAVLGGAANGNLVAGEGVRSILVLELVLTVEELDISRTMAGARGVTAAV